MSQLSRQCGIFNSSQPYRPPRPVTGITFFPSSFTLGDKHPSYSTVNSWVARFRTGHLSMEDKDSSGGPTHVTVPESMDAIHSMILDD
jgi:hypothetical protein